MRPGAGMAGADGDIGPRGCGVGCRGRCPHRPAPYDAGVFFGGLGRRAAFACWKSSKSPQKLEVSRTDYDITAKNKDMISAASFHPGHKDLPRTLLPLL